MKPDEFEKRLADLPLKSPPSSWRKEILDAAGRARHESAVIVPAPFAPGWRDLLWPSPQAWAGLAAAWVIIAALNISGPQDRPNFAGTAPSATEPEPGLATQRSELARLLDNAPETAPTPQPPRTGPRSDRSTPRALNRKTI